MATHSSILAGKIPWTEEPGGLTPWGHKESDTPEVTYTHACTSPFKPSDSAEVAYIFYIRSFNYILDNI